MLIVRASPTRLRQAWNFAAVGGLTQLGACQAELAVHAARTPGDRAAVALPRRRCIARLALQFRLAYFFAILRRFFSRMSIFVLAMSYYPTYGTES
jgi:hypothetical protein